MVEAAKGTLLDDFTSWMWGSFQDDSISHAFPKQSCPWALQVLHFRLLAGALCAVQSVLGKPWRSYPVKLFSWLDEGKSSFLEDPACILDPLATMLRQRLGSCSNEEAHAVLTTLSSEFSMDISTIEARHSSTRRILHITSVQVSTPSLEEVSASWVCRTNAIDLREKLPGKRDPNQQSDQRDTDKDALEGSKSHKRKRRTLAPWNAFVSKFFHGEKFAGLTMKDCSAAWKELSETDLRALKDDVREAQIRQSFGHHSFPKASKAGSQPTGNTNPEEQLQLATDNLSLDTLEASLASIRAERRKESKSQSMLQQQDLQELMNFQHDADVQQRFEQAFGISQDLKSSYAPFPAPIPSVEVHLPADTLSQDGGR